MITIIENREWCLAIFKHLLINPSLHEEYNFRAEYFDYEGRHMGDLYYGMRDLITNQGMVYSQKTMEIACFTVVYKDMYELYRSHCEKEQFDKFDKNQQIAFGVEMDRISSLYESIESIYSSLSKEFIEDKAIQLVEQKAIYHRMTSLIEKYTTSGDMEHEQFIREMNDQFNYVESMYQMPLHSKHSYIDFFDENLLVEVNNKLYQSLIYPLNNFLNGGFRKQTVTGFLTKTGGGKSTLLFTLAADALLSGYNVAFVNLEMNDYEVNANIMSALCQNHTHKAILMNLTNEEYMKGVKEELSSKKLGQYALISNRGCFDQIDMKWLYQEVNKLERKISAKNGEDFTFDFVIIDYLYLMQPVKRMSKSVRSDEIYRQVTIEAHEFAQEHDYAVLTVFQGNRGAEQKLANSERLTLADVGESYGAFKDIDYVFSISRYVQGASDGILIEPLKTRQYDGEYTGIYVPYIQAQKRYNSSLAYIMDLDEIDVHGKVRNKGASKTKITLEEVLDFDSSLKSIPCGVISNTLSGMKVFHGSYKYIVEEFKRRDWEILKVDDIENADIDSMREKIINIVDKIRGNTVITPAVPKLPQVNPLIIDSKSDDLFAI